MVEKYKKIIKNISFLAILFVILISGNVVFATENNEEKKMQEAICGENCNDDDKDNIHACKRKLSDKYGIELSELDKNFESTLSIYALNSKKEKASAKEQKDNGAVFSVKITYTLIDNDAGEGVGVSTDTETKRYTMGDDPIIIKLKRYADDYEEIYVKVEAIMKKHGKDDGDGCEKGYFVLIDSFRTSLKDEKTSYQRSGEDACSHYLSGDISFDAEYFRNEYAGYRGADGKIKDNYKTNITFFGEKYNTGTNYRDILKKLNAGGDYSITKIYEANAFDELKKLMPYCFESNSEYVYSQSMIVAQLYKTAQIALKRAELKSEYKELKKEYADEGYVKVTNPTTNRQLWCDAFNTADGKCDQTEVNQRKFYYVDESYDIKSQVHKNPKESTDITVCKVECVEAVKVSYSPPVSVKAGQCFEYEVKIESKKTCAANITGEKPEYSDYEVCTPTSWCNDHGALYYDQGGPNEDFDNCVKELDGGKYTQKAINKCYTKVYGKKKNNSDKVSLALDYTDNIKVVQIKDDAEESDDGDDKYHDPDTYCIRPVYDKNRDYWTVATAKKVVNAYTINGFNGGFYYRGNDNKIHWQDYDDEDGFSVKNNNLLLADGTRIKTKLGCYWNVYARYYYNNQAKGIRMVLNDAEIKKTYNPGDNGGEWYKPEKNEGFKRGLSCNENCRWSAPKDCYLNYIAPNQEITTKYGTVTGQSSYNAYIKDLNAYQTKLEECKAANECNDTTTAEYTMTVNSNSKSEEEFEDKAKSNKCYYNPRLKDDVYVRKNANGELCDFDATTYMKDKTSFNGCSETKENSIIKEVSGDCTTLNDKNWQYRTVISFPGTWVGNKLGDCKYQKPDKDQFYTYKEGQYCIELDAEEVNTDWWLWKNYYDASKNLSYSKEVREKYGQLADEQRKKVSVKETQNQGVTIQKYTGKKNDNIKATIKDFGYYKWNFDLSCFYGLKNDSDNPVVPDTPSTPSTPSTPDENCEDGCCDETCTNAVVNSETRAASLKELFPQTDETGVTKSSNKSTKKVTPSKLNYSDNSKKNKVTKVADSSTTSTGRTPGYNWSCEATNLNIKDYPITPTVLTKTIENKGESIYNDKKELDYSISLSTSDIREIRKYNDSGNKAYDDYNGKFLTKEDKEKNDLNNIKFYWSNIIHPATGKYLTLNKFPSKGTGIFCNNLSNGKCDNLKNYYTSNGLNNNDSCSTSNTNLNKWLGLGK